jgi:hypothetical protein
LTIFRYATLVSVIEGAARLKPVNFLATQGVMIFPMEHTMSMISFYCGVKGLFRKFAVTSSFHGPPKARVRSA